MVPSIWIISRPLAGIVDPHSRGGSSTEGLSGRGRATPPSLFRRPSLEGGCPQGAHPLPR
eukprot:417221-Pyramimonas_sp.AAC.1